MDDGPHLPGRGPAVAGAHGGSVPDRAEVLRRGQRLEQVGPVYYGNRVNVAIAAQGLYLERPGIIRLPFLLIPWAQIKQVREAAGLWRRRMVLWIGQPHITTIWLPMHVFARVQPYLPSNAIGHRP